MGQKLGKAAEDGDLERVKKIIKRSSGGGAHRYNINCRNGEHDMTPLHEASSKGHADVVSVLLENEALTTLTDNRGRTALHFAAECGDLATLQLLIDKDPSSLSLATKRKESALIVAVLAGKQDAVVALLDQGADVDCKDLDGKTPLICAAYAGRIHVVQLLLDRGVSLGERDTHGNTSLHRAAFEGHHDVCSLLIRAGIKCDVVNSRGDTPLLMAAEAGQVSVAKVLLQHGASPTTPNNEGRTALDSIARRRQGIDESTKTALENLFDGVDH